jgi:spore coat polysaccharide biosynthesis protein SpsF
VKSLSQLRIGVISQARMTSTRLPGKVLKEIKGRSLLDYHVLRLRKSGFPVIIATTSLKTDDPIAQFCQLQELPIFRGDEMDVLSRYEGAAQKHSLDLIVRVTSDCPLIDGDLIRQGVETYLRMQKSWLYLSNCLERTFPRGFDFEIFSREMLSESFNRAQSSSEREHVTPYIHQNRHGKTQFHHIKRSPDMSSYRLTVDEPADFELMRRLIEDFECEKKNQDEICKVLIENPDLKSINAHIEQKKV